MSALSKVRDLLSVNVTDASFEDVSPIDEVLLKKHKAPQGSLVDGPKPESTPPSSDQAATTENTIKPQYHAFKKANAFVTKESFMTFSVASGVLTAIVAFFSLLFNNLIILALLFSGLWGAFNYFIHITEPTRANTITKRDKIIAGGLAFINSLILASSVYGSTLILQGVTPKIDESSTPKPAQIGKKTPNQE